MLVSSRVHRLAPPTHVPSPSSTSTPQPSATLAPVDQGRLGAPGVRIADLALQIPNVTFPFNVTGGAARYQKQRCLFGQLDLELSPALIKLAEAKLLEHGPELARLQLHLRAGFIEAEGALRAG